MKRVKSMDEQEEQPMINLGMPCYSRLPGVEIEDILEIENERESAIANGDT